MLKKLLTKKLFIKVFYLIVIIFLIVIIERNMRIPKILNNLEKISVEKENNEKIAKQETIDSDNDGLYDWEEILYKTNPHNSDSDEDGVSDYVEIQNNTNPLSLKNDNIDIIEIKGTKENILSLKEQKKLFFEVRMRRSRTEELMKKVKVLSDEEKKIIQESKKLKKNIKTSVNEMANAIRNNYYKIENLYKIINSLVATISYEEDISIGKDFGNNEIISISDSPIIEDKDLLKLKVLSGSYLKIAGGLNKVAAIDDELIKIIKKFKESYSNLNQGLNQMIDAAEKHQRIPFSELKNGYTKYSIKNTMIFGEINRYINAHGIEFNMNDSGILFIR